MLTALWVIYNSILMIILGAVVFATPLALSYLLACLIVRE